MKRLGRPTKCTKPGSKRIVFRSAAWHEARRVLGWQQSAQAAGRLVGPAVAGADLAAAGAGAALVLQAALMACAAPCAVALWRGAAPAPSFRRDAGWWSDLRAGLRANAAIPLERGWMASNFLAWIFLFPALTLLVPLKVQSLDLSALWLGGCEAGLSLGMLVGSLGGTQPVIRCFGRFRTRVGAAVLQGVALAVAGWTAQPLLLVAAFVAAGYCNAAVTLVGSTHRLLARPAAFRARMSAGSVVTSQVAASLGPALAGMALTRWHVDMVYAVFGLAGAVASASLAVVPGFRAFMALGPEALDGWYQRRHPEAFPP